VLQLIAEGHTNSEIAKLLAISVKTVEKHRANLMSKLDVHDVAGLVRNCRETQTDLPLRVKPTRPPVVSPLKWGVLFTKGNDSPHRQ